MRRGEGYKSRPDWEVAAAKRALLLLTRSFVKRWLANNNVFAKRGGVERLGIGPRNLGIGGQIVVRT